MQMHQEHPCRPKHYEHSVNCHFVSMQELYQHAALLSDCGQLGPPLSVDTQPSTAAALTAVTAATGQHSHATPRQQAR
jgi:hypothetical protein